MPFGLAKVGLRYSYDRPRVIYPNQNCVNTYGAHRPRYLVMTRFYSIVPDDPRTCIEHVTNTMRTSTLATIEQFPHWHTAFGPAMFRSTTTGTAWEWQNDGDPSSPANTWSALIQARDGSSGNNQIMAGYNSGGTQYYALRITGASESVYSTFNDGTTYENTSGNLNASTNSDPLCVVQQSCRVSGGTAMPGVLHTPSDSGGVALSWNLSAGANVTHTGAPSSAHNYIRIMADANYHGFVEAVIQRAGSNDMTWLHPNRDNGISGAGGTTGPYGHYQHETRWMHLWEPFPASLACAVTNEAVADLAVASLTMFEPSDLRANPRRFKVSKERRTYIVPTENN